MNSAVTQIISALKIVAAKLGQGAEALYRAYYTQTVLVGVEKIVTTILVIGLVAVGTWFGYKKLRELLFRLDKWEIKEAKFSLGDEQTYFTVLKVALKGSLILVSIIIVVNLIGVVVSSYTSLLTGVNYVVNPNYQTIQTILTQVTGR